MLDILLLYISVAVRCSQVITIKDAENVCLHAHCQAHAELTRIESVFYDYRRSVDNGL